MKENDRKRMVSIALIFCLGVSAFLLPGSVFSQEAEETDPQENAELVQEEPTEEETAAEEAQSDLEISAKSAILIDGKTGTVLFEKNSHEELPPASVTKIMSMLLVMEAVDSGQIGLDDMVSISERAAKMGGSQLFMEPGEQHTVEELMKGAAMASANDACVALAEYVSGSETAFVKKMNERAKELGMVNTNFENTNGLPVANHYTSAYDIALMSKELMAHEIVKEWLTTWMDTMMVGLEGKQTEFGLANTNKLIKQYNGATGIKTGYTADAKFCLAGSATRDNMELIGVVLGADTSQIRFGEMADLLDYGFALYDSVQIAEKDIPIQEIKIEKGKEDLIQGIVEENVDVLVKKEEKQSISHEIIFNEKIKAPISRGDQIGSILIYRDGVLENEYPVVADRDIEKAGPIQLYFKLFHSTLD